MSKFSLDVLQKRVFPFARSNDPDVILGAAFGEDVALTKVGSDILASHVDPIVGAIGNIGHLAVHVACNDIATSGIPPRWILLLILVPKASDVELLEQIMQDANRAAEEINVTIIGGHSGYSAGISRPLVSVTAFGVAQGRQPVLTGGANPGDLVILTRGIGLEGTGILAQDFAQTAKKLKISDKEIEQAKHLMETVSVVKEALAIAEAGASSMHDVTRGGALETLLEISLLSEVNITIDEDKLPIPSIVKRFADVFKFDPIKMISSGTLAVTISPRKLRIVEDYLYRHHIDFSVVGTVREGEGVTISSKEKSRTFIEIRCEDDELARMWTVYKPDSR